MNMVHQHGTMQSLPQTIRRGNLKGRLKDRFNKHRRPTDNANNIYKPTTVSEHFLTNYHSANDITLIPLELIHSNRDSIRKAREAYLIDRGRTLESLGLNIIRKKCNTFLYSIVIFTI